MECGYPLYDRKNGRKQRPRGITFRGREIPPIWLRRGITQLRKKCYLWGPSLCYTCKWKDCQMWALQSGACGIDRGGTQGWLGANPSNPIKRIKMQLL